MLVSVLGDAVELQMDGIWAVVDHYKEAVVLTREKDVENEAIALSRLGSVFHKVLKDYTRAHVYFTRCMELAFSMRPRLFDCQNWYRECRDALAEYQTKAVAADEAAAAEARAPYLEQISEEIEALRKAADAGSHRLLKFVYQTHPPKDPKHTLTAEPCSDNLKSLLLTAVKHYHPDKQRQFRYEEKWCVLCEEITKKLNQAYMKFK